MAAQRGTRQLRRLIRDVGKLPDDVRRELRAKLKTAGQKALADARANASWSTRIPPATRLSVKLTKRRAGLSLQVNKKRAPHGRAYERLGRPGFFRHPVFGNRRVWVRQKARPFLWPAARPVWRDVDAHIGAAVDEAARKFGRK